MAKKLNHIMRHYSNISKWEKEEWEKSYTPPYTKNRDKIKVTKLDSNVVQVLEGIRRLGESHARTKYPKDDVDLATLCLEKTNGNVQGAIEKLQAYKRALWKDFEM